jgi:hypothetical protein
VSLKICESLALALANEEQIEERMDSSLLMPSFALRWFYIRLNQFFWQHQLATVATNIPVPPFSDIWNDILIDNWHAPELTLRYLLKVPKDSSSAAVAWALNIPMSATSQLQQEE